MRGGAAELQRGLGGDRFDVGGAADAVGAKDPLGCVMGSGSIRCAEVDLRYRLAGAMTRAVAGFTVISTALQRRFTGDLPLDLRGGERHRSSPHTPRHPLSDSRCSTSRRPRTVTSTLAGRTLK